ncbi:FAD/NAD(P)-binding domain-containing protein [Westerdykella ornata]|uniref:FAD/NAD(P)-binding domain-containing protein n=1 Tax=Westerdykella ornata TaxID=318751 RepID=A0A6A6JPB1_WESOR|nr:FAD/NAD(P)-binding domain-containing protein [Westerdykella ornata]KAF2278362.1 FAD/NAD(P)-binding domain-containing protein [Westerdykella ornata]
MVRTKAARAILREAVTPQSALTTRNYATVSPAQASGRMHRVVLVGGGTAGLSVSHQLLRSGKFAKDDIAIIDPATWHHYQPGWTLAAGGLRNKDEFKQPLANLIDPKLKFYNTGVDSFAPEDRTVTLANGDKVTYEQLVVAPGIKTDTSSIKGLPEALADPHAPVSCVYTYETCDKVANTVQAFKKGNAIFTQPAGVVKCAGAPQKVMWLSWDYWKRNGLYDNTASSPIHISFATGLPVMFGVPKYNAILDALRKERGIDGLFQHDLVSIDGNTVTFALPDGSKVEKKFDFLHAVPKMGPHPFIKNSPLADETGYVAVNTNTLQHKKYPNVWSLGDAANIPTSKTAAAITAQTPTVVQNLMLSMENKDAPHVYDGYTSCPLTVGEKKVLLAEFKYGGEPKETFGQMFGIDQGTPRRAFFHLKKDFFPWVYKNYMVKGAWGGPKGFVR